MTAVLLYLLLAYRQPPGGYIGHSPIAQYQFSTLIKTV
jgi:hypothetical protein